MEWNLSSLTTWVVANGLRIAIVIIAAWLAIVAVRRAINSLGKRLLDRIGEAEKIEAQKRIQTLTGLGRTVASLTILAVAIMVVLGQLGIKLGPILAAAGIVGLAIGFRAQSLVKDVISGLFILIENQFNVGDVIQAAGVAGLVERSNLRVTVIRDLEGKVHYIPNGQISVLSNLRKEWARAVLNIGVAYKEDTDQVAEILTRVGEDLQNDPEFGPKILEPIQIFGVNEFADSAVVMLAGIKTKPLQQWSVAREFRRRMKKAFDTEGIEIPFPHRTVYMGEAESKGRLTIAMDQQTSVLQKE